MIPKRPFLQWFCLFLTYIVAFFFAWNYNLVSLVWHGDITYICTTIGVFSLVVMLYMGYASWRFDSSKTANADVGLGRTFAFIVTLIGLLGTAIGLQLQVKAMGTIDVTTSQNIVAFIAAISTALGSALYTTICGIISAVAITFMTSNIEYFIDLEDE